MPRVPRDISCFFFFSAKFGNFAKKNIIFFSKKMDAKNNPVHKEDILYLLENKDNWQIET